MKRILQLIISLFYFLLVKIQEFISLFSGGIDKPKCVALYYHSIFDDEKKNFEWQMRILDKSTVVVSPDGG